ncbi:MAG: DUF2971 domain-containing protein [Pirellulales bacterium]
MAIIAANEPPSLLYKFRPFGSEQQRKWVRSILIDNHLFAPTSELLNDPFDLCIEMTFQGNKAIVRERATAWVNRRSRHLSRHDRRKKTAESIKQMKLTGKTEIKKYLAKTGIVSFATQCESQLLWAHYADAHRGICIEFDYKRPWRLGKEGALCEVRYQSERVIPDYFKSTPIQVIDSMILTKSEDWKYEGEYRVICNPRPRGGLLPFNPGLISRVFVGCRMQDDDLELLKAMLRERTTEPKPQLLKMAPSDKTYSLVSTPLEY